LCRRVIKPIVDVAWMTGEKGLDQVNDLGSLFDRRRWNTDLLRGNCNGYPLPPSPVRIKHNVDAERYGYFCEDASRE
jgi:hypothetical protein